MRRALMSALTVPVILLSACGGDEPSVQEPGGAASTPAGDAAASTAPSTAPSGTGTGGTTQPPADDATQTTGDQAMTSGDAATQSAGDQAGATGGGAVPGGAEGQAAADRTEEFLVALSTADPELCQLVISIDGKGPMADAPEQLKQCEDQLIPQLEGSMPPEAAEVLGMVEVNGAQVEGDTATVSGDNLSSLFADAFGGQEFMLKKFDGEWYVDLANMAG